MLQHVKIIELTDGLGDYTGQILAQLGAQVTKLVAPGADTASLDFLAFNHGKTLLPLANTDLAALVRDADILIARPKLIPAGTGELAAQFPALIQVMLEDFALSAPLHGQPASDLTLMALSGIMNIVGNPGAAPLKLPGEQAYALAGIQGAIAALLALNDRAASGLGQQVMVSAHQSAVLAGYRDPIVWEWTGRLGQRSGNRLVRGQSGVRQVWQCLDGFVTWSMVDNPGLMKGTVALMAREHAAGALAEVNWDKSLVADWPQPRIDALEATIEAFFLAHSGEELTAMNAEIPIGLSLIETPAMALGSPHWQERGFWEPVIDPATGVTLQLPARLFVSQP